MAAAAFSFCRALLVCSFSCCALAADAVDFIVCPLFLVRRAAMRPKFPRVVCAAQILKRRLLACARQAALKVRFYTRRVSQFCAQSDARLNSYRVRFKRAI